MKNFDLKYYNGNTNFIAGIDEAGRGPLAGPVVIASVIFRKEDFIENVNDSKKLNEKQREILYSKIITKAISYSIVIIDNKEIDRINILQATLQGMKLAAESLQIRPDLCLVDGNKCFNSTLNQLSIVKGDALSFSIAAASILAKVTRDKIMKDYHNDFPIYGWNKNKGYPTKSHIASIKVHGPSNLHRKSFLKKILGVQYEFDY